MPRTPTVLLEAPLTPSGFFVLRTPLLPFDELLSLGQELVAPLVPLDDGPALEAALARDRALLRERLRRLVARPEVREALFLASPSLDESLALWLREPEGERGQKVERALVRYVARMAGRPTPFGLFAGCSLGRTGDTTVLRTGPREHYRRHGRLDMDFLLALTDALGKAPELRGELRYRCNDSLYRAAGRVRWTSARIEKNVRGYHLVTAEPTAYLEATIEQARHGVRLSELAAHLVSADPEISLEDAESYLTELVDAQLLVPELAPRVTGDEPLEGLIASLREHPGALSTLTTERLGRAATSLRELDRVGLGARGEQYRAIAAELEGLSAPVELPRLFQVDLYKPAPEAQLGPDVLAELRRAIELVRRMTRSDDALRSFVEDFVTRYGDEEVPLLEALDEECGIGFQASKAPSAAGEPLLEGLPFPEQPRSAGTFGARETALLRKLHEALTTGALCVELSPEDLEKLTVSQPPVLPDAFAAMAVLSAASPEELSAGRFQLFLSSVSGPSGALLMGRFCHGEPALAAAVAEHLRSEEALRPDAVHAEIVHLPQGRIGNVLLRPVLRGHEIPFLGRSGAPSERQLPLEDLSVRVEDERVVLRSRRLGREVIPRLTTAHNFTGPMNLGVYRFLCALQSQGTAPALQFDWGPLSRAPFLPRLTFGRVVLSRARWRVEQEPLQALGRTSGAERYSAVQRLRAELHLPRRIHLAEGDNELPVDLDNALDVESLVQLVKDLPGAVLLEPFAGPEGLCATGPEGRFTHELIVPFVRGDRVPKPARVAVPLPALFPRRFPPGTEWLQVRLYTGTAGADAVLREVVAPVVRQVVSSGAADNWFFIRYVDPDWHLRLRFHGRPEVLLGEVFPALWRAAAPFLEDRRLWNVQLGTYEREVQRYGGPEAIALAERLFCADSEAVLGILQSLEELGGAGARWRLAACGIDTLLGDLGLELEARHALLRRLRADFGKRFKVDAAFERRLGERFRRERPTLESLLEAEPGAREPLSPALELLRRRSERVAPVVAELRALERSGRLSCSIEEQAASYVHMHTNRLFRDAALAQELVLYDFLERYYASKLARARRRS
ncbi:lantibiotic dehydratase [Hyalangium rubrum]|uniref:Lantibiotic dehydratase n=1 Tax=Hyalangium rubrum TaxID=3103134 RepID=A0ABU5H5H5_9BACT|nr:lantibiotic dehydratase [Hyalangium sp. s54d21]MDY7228737.1 lantibiotic dehydratase [Hyalangium sp. s54d21]